MGTVRHYIIVAGNGKLIGKAEADPASFPGGTPPPSHIELEDGPCDLNPADPRGGWFWDAAKRQLVRDPARQKQDAGGFTVTAEQALAEVIDSLTESGKPLPLAGIWRKEFARTIDALQPPTPKEPKP